MEEADINKALNRLARQQMIERLYRDILIDMAVCEIEGWDKMEYIKDLQEVINRFGNEYRKTGSSKDNTEALR